MSATNCATCDRCTALEMSPGQFLYCEACESTLCDYHQHGDYLKSEDMTCGNCRELANERAHERASALHYGGSR